VKIVDVRAIPLPYRCNPPYGSAGGMQAAGGALFVEVETDGGITGIGEAGVCPPHVIENQPRRCCSARPRC
jgi:L-alanine-DL-glutamate epimerase-like enolase superfamily enzyme